jgi:hypothetical protein
VATEPVFAEDVAALFNVALRNNPNAINYRMKTKNDIVFGGQNGFIESKEEVLKGIAKLVRNNH